MTLIEFLHHIKHLSLKIVIIEKDKIVFLNNMGTYLHLVKRNLYDDKEIYRISFGYNNERDVMVIWLKDNEN